MLRRPFAAVLLACILTLFLAACGAAVTPPAPPEEATPSPVETPAPTPKPTGEPVSPPEPTPDMSELPPSWFDDAVFLGDSVSKALENYCEQTGALGDAVFLCEISFSVRNAVYERVELWYQGRSGRADDIVALTGARKVFLMLGTNDVAMDGGVEGTVRLWRVLVNMIREKNPGAVFFVESCLPMYGEAQMEELNNDTLDEYNQALRAYCQEANCVFVDIADAFKDEDNALAEEYSSDHYVHLKTEAGELWAQLLRDPSNYSVDPRSLKYENAP